MLQYKIIHNILPYGSKLYKMKISNSTLCVHCNSLETLPHMLVNCTEINMQFLGKNNLLVESSKRRLLPCRWIKHTLWLLFRRQKNSNFQLFYFNGKETHFCSENSNRRPLTSTCFFILLKASWSYINVYSNPKG